MATEQQPKRGLVGRLFAKISAWFSKLFSKLKRAFRPKPAAKSAQPEPAQNTAGPNAETEHGGEAPPNTQPHDTQILLGALQTMVASPASPVEVAGNEKPNGADHTEEPVQEYVPKIRPKPSPPLPKEHRDLVRKLVRAGKRREAAAQLEELGYLFAEVSTRGKYIVVKYRGRDGYLYAARIRYKP